MQPTGGGDVETGGGDHVIVCTSEVPIAAVGMTASLAVMHQWAQMSVQFVGGGRTQRNWAACMSSAALLHFAAISFCRVTRVLKA